MAATNCSSSSSLPYPCPKSPPKYPDMTGKHRELVKVQKLEREIGFLQEELKSIESLQPASRSCKEVNDYVGANPDPLIPVNQKTRNHCRFWKWLCGKSCLNLSWICCSSRCCLTSSNCPSCSSKNKKKRHCCFGCCGECSKACSCPKPSCSCCKCSCLGKLSCRNCCCPCLFPSKKSCSDCCSCIKCTSCSSCYKCPKCPNPCLCSCSCPNCTNISCNPCCLF